MKILFWMFTSFDSPSTSEHLLIAVVRQLCEAGNEVCVLQKNTGGSCPLIPDSLKEYNVSSVAVPFLVPNKGNFVARYISELKYIMSCKKHLRSDFEAVFIQSNTVAGFAVKEVSLKCRNAKITFNVQDIFPYNALYSGKIKRKNFLFRVLSLIQKYAYAKANNLIVVSEDMKNLLIECGVNSMKINVVYNWSYQDGLYGQDTIDTKIQNRIFNKKYYNVLYAGNIGIMQNVDLVVKTAKLMKEYNDVWFIIVGDGIYKNRLQRMAKELELTNITFLSMQPSKDAPSIYAGADVNVIPLAKNIYKTALPSKTATCLACGKPIVFAIGKESKFGERIAKETDCMVVSTENPKELMEAIVHIKNSKISEKKTGMFFSNYMSLSINSRKYASIITGIEEKNNEY